MLNIPKEVKELFEKDSVRKNVRIHFPNGERADITNSNLIAESFSFTESVMSQSEFRFGLCEASMVEFECFGVENIKDYEIEVFHEIDISSLGEEFIDEYGMTSEDVAFPYYRVPYGKFTVDEALRQADMVRRKVTAYGKMVENLKPNEIELAKSEVTYTASISMQKKYDIDLIKYLYSNSNFKGEIPNSTISDAYSNSTYIAKFCKDNYTLEVTNISVYEEFGDNNLFKVTLGERILSVEDVFYKIWEYLSEIRFPHIEWFFEDWDSILKKIATDRIEIGNKSLFLKNDMYIYGGSIMGIYIPISFAIYDINGNKEKEFVIRNNDLSNIEKVEFNAPQIIISYPLKKVGSSYAIKDMPYDQLSKDIEEAIELQGKFGKVDRYGNFQMISVNNKFGLTPSKTLVPSNTLVPRGIKGEVLQKGNYSSLWYDDFKTKPYDRVSVSYKNADEEEMYAEHLIVDIESDTYNASDYQAYSLTENTLIQNGTFTEAQINEILETVAESLIGLQYMPFEMDCVGLPYLEAGDAVLIETQNGNFQTLVLDRRIDGIQSLKDNLNAN